MHETSIVNSIMRTLEQEFEAEKLKDEDHSSKGWHSLKY